MRSWLVLAALACAVRADARPAPGPLLPEAHCWLGDDVVPATGARDVPLDAKVWLFDTRYANEHYTFTVKRGTQVRRATAKIHKPFEIVELDIGTLVPNQTYEVFVGEQPLTTFKTGTAKSGATATPTIVSAAAVNDLPQTSRIKLIVEPTGPDVLAETLVRHEGGDVIAKLFVRARALGDLGAECAGFHLQGATRVCFDVRVVDVAGKRGEVATQCTDVEQGPGMESSYDSRYDDPTHAEPPAPPTWPWIVVFVTAGFVGGVAFVMLRDRHAHRAFARAEARPVDAEIVRRLARMQRATAEVVLALAGGALVLLDLVAEADVRAILASGPLSLIVITIARAQRLHTLIASLGDPNVTTAYDGKRYVLARRGDTTIGWLAALPAQLELVAQQAMPQAKTRR